LDCWQNWKGRGRILTHKYIIVSQLENKMGIAPTLTPRKHLDLEREEEGGNSI